MNLVQRHFLGSRKPGPFIKWAGGKSQLLKQFQNLYAFEFDTYFEPFLGGGAVFFDLYSMNRIKRAILSDRNPDLMNLWAALRDNPNELISLLESLRVWTDDKHFYYTMRREFNSIFLRKDFMSEPNVRKAALLIFLNKTCYNGLYRVNARGKFNVPFGRNRSPQLFDYTNLMTVNKILGNTKRVKLHCADFLAAVSSARPRDFVYLDPPYQPLNSTSSFTGYTAPAFDPKEQERLASVFQELDLRGCYVMASNSHKLDFLEPLYARYFEKGFCRVVSASRTISCVGVRRGGHNRIKEFVIMNYSPHGLLSDSVKVPA